MATLGVTEKLYVDPPSNEVSREAGDTTKSDDGAVVRPEDPLTVTVQMMAADMSAGFVPMHDNEDAVVGVP